jgi:hypothetical protein
VRGHVRDRALCSGLPLHCCCDCDIPIQEGVLRSRATLGIGLAALALIALEYGHAVFTLGNRPMLLLGSGVLGLAQVIRRMML